MILFPFFCEPPVGFMYKADMRSIIPCREKPDHLKTKLIVLGATD
jgi:hypothetical protein